MNSVRSSPLFWFGFALRLVLLTYVAPTAATQWYVPFMSQTANHFSIDPWHTFVVTGGTTEAFPYGYVM
jgi:hypothetical protein